jgi:hypothetical protein
MFQRLTDRRQRVYLCQQLEHEMGIMTFVHYLLKPKMVECYYEVFVDDRVGWNIHLSYCGNFWATFHLYQGQKPFEKVAWINGYLYRFKYDVWDICDLVEDVVTMIDCLRFCLILDGELGEYVCQ